MHVAHHPLPAPLAFSFPACRCNYKVTEYHRHTAFTEAFNRKPLPEYSVHPSQRSYHRNRDRDSCSMKKRVLNPLALSDFEVGLVMGLGADLEKQYFYGHTMSRQWLISSTPQDKSWESLPWQMGAATLVRLTVYMRYDGTRRPLYTISPHLRAYRHLHRSYDEGKTMECILRKLNL